MYCVSCFFAYFNSRSPIPLSCFNTDLTFLVISLLSLRGSPVNFKSDKFGVDVPFTAIEYGT